MSIEPKTAARLEAEKFRIHILNVALAARNGRDGDLRDAVEMFIAAIADSFDRTTITNQRGN